MLGTLTSQEEFSENLDFEFDDHTPAIIDITDKKSGETLHCVIRGYDPDDLYFSTLKNKLCYGHFVFRLRLSSQMKNKLNVARGIKNYTVDQIQESIKEQPITPYYGCLLDCIAVLGDEYDKIPDDQKKMFIEHQCPYIVGKKKTEEPVEEIQEEEDVDYIGI
jgi:hypothetical protein